MTNTTTTFEATKFAGMATTMDVNAFTAFVMQPSNGVTIAVLHDELKALNVTDFNTKTRKPVLAGMLYEAVVALAAKDETSAAAPITNQTQTKIEEELTMTNEIKLAEVVNAGGLNTKQLSANEAMLNKSKATKGDAFDMIKTNKEAYMNPNLKEMLDRVDMAKAKYIEDVTPHEIKLLNVEFYRSEEELKGMNYRDAQALRRAKKVQKSYKNDNGTMTNYIGEVTVQLPAGYAQVKKFNPEAIDARTGKKGANEWVDFVGYDVNAVVAPFDPKFSVVEGHGLVSMKLKEVDGELRVNLPMHTWRNSKGPVFVDAFKTSDSRFVKGKDASYVDEPLYLADNNTTFGAQVTAMVQLYAEEFVQENAANRHGFNESSCVSRVNLRTMDGVTDDLDSESKKSPVRIQQPDVMQLAQVGSYQPTTFCGVNGEWLDLEAAMLLNEATTHEPVSYFDEDGVLRYQRHDEVMIAGKAVKINEVKEQMIEAKCSQCPFYCGNARKSEQQIGKEKAQLREKGEKNPYVNPYYRTRPTAGRQAIQFLVEQGGQKEWMTANMDEVKGNAVDVRVKGAGMMVVVDPRILSFFNLGYEIPTEAYDERKAVVAKQIAQIWHAAYTLNKLDEEQAAVIFDMAAKKPSNLTAKEEERWDKAVQGLVNAIQWAQEREEANNVALYKTVFHTTPVEGAKAIDLTEIIADTMFRMEENSIGYGLGYSDLDSAEFVRYLDEVAIDYVYDYILNGTEYYVTANFTVDYFAHHHDARANREFNDAIDRSERDIELVAGALQHMLQSELTGNFYSFANGDYREASLVTGVKRAENQAAALGELNVNDDIKDYIAGLVVASMK
jgi:hypothetical protein